MKFAKAVFIGAGIWGLLILSPLYFLIDTVAVDHPSVRTEPQFYLGFAAVAVAWQVAFLVIGTNPTRFRTLMLTAMLEKFGYVLSMTVLYVGGRLIQSEALIVIVPDFVLGVLFVAAYLRTPAVEYRLKSSTGDRVSSEQAIGERVFQ